MENLSCMALCNVCVCGCVCVRVYVHNPVSARKILRAQLKEGNDRLGKFPGNVDVWVTMCVFAMTSLDGTI